MGFPGGLGVKNPPAKQEAQFLSLGWEEPLEQKMVTHSIILAWKIPWTGEPDGLHIHEVTRVGHSLLTKQQQQATIV